MLVDSGATTIGADGSMFRYESKPSWEYPRILEYANLGGFNPFEHISQKSKWIINVSRREKSIKTTT